MTVTSGDRHLTVLFVDDKEKNFLIKQRLESAFGKLGCTVELTYQKDPDAASTLLSAVPRRFDVLIADLLFRPVGDTGESEIEEPRGVDLIREARAAHPTIVIIGLTTQLTVHHPDLDQRAKEAGADLALLRGNLMSETRYGGTDRLAREIFKFAVGHGLIEAGPVLDPTDEPGVEMVIADVGKAHLRLLLSELSPVPGVEPQSVSLTYVAPGASGARVLRADAKMPDGSTRTLLVKLGRDGDALAREVANSRSIQGLYANNLVIRYLDRGVVSRNGWTAIATEFAHDAVTLRRWLPDPASAPHVPSLFGRLFLNRGLAHGYRPPVEPAPAEPPVSRLTLPPFRRVRVSAAVEEIACLLDHPLGVRIAEGAAMLKVIRDYSRDGRIDGVPASDTPSSGLVLVNAHGDLHGANVLVYDDESPRPLIIDLASYKPHHWAYDLARMVADIILRVLDAPAELYFWRRFDEWRNIACGVGNLQVDMVDEPANAGAMAALNWIGRHREQLLPELGTPERWWEWHVALAEQLLRGTYQPHLPPPKRVLGLVSAYDQLVVARSKIPSRDGW